MSVQQFCLRWNNHQPNFISVCSSLLHNGTLVDVTLAAEGRQLQAHKIVLSACSSYFQTLFTTNPCQHPIVILKDVQYDDLKTMVDFMYYGEVNVSQEQLPHILKTAEMLKIKGLAEMPTDPANLTKSADCKSSSEPTDLIGNNGGITASQGGSGSGGNLGSGTSGSVSDSLWGSTDSQFQQQQHHHHQQQLQQQQQQHHHHQQQHHQQQQQSSQTQINQHHQLRRTPSPLGAGASPATRRKRLRKSSNNGSGDRNCSEDQHVGSLDAPSNTTGSLSLAQMSQMSFSASASSLGGLGGHLHSSKLLKESTSSELEQHPHDSDSLDDGQGHVHMQIKPEVDISGVQQTMPLDISGTTTPSEHDAPNCQSSHAGLQWTVVDSSYSRFSLSCQPNLIGSTGNQNSANTSAGGANSGNGSNNNNEQQRQQQQQQHQQQSDPQSSASNQQQSQHLQQLQQYQQQQQQHQANATYSPQIIAVNNLVGGYAAASDQDLSPTSPNETHMVQTVYSEGPTPIQSPVHAAGNSNAGLGSISGNGSSVAPAIPGANQQVKRKRSINPQGDENFIRALEAVRTGGIGFCKAARLYGVNNRTLWLEYKKRGYPVSRPSIKSRVKQEPNLSPSPTPPTTDDTTNENFEHMSVAAAAVVAAQTAALNMQTPPTSDTPTPTSLMCAPHHASAASATTTHPAMNVMSFLDTRHMDFQTNLHTMSRQRYIDATGAATGGATGASAINVNPATAMNLQSINFNSI